MVIYKKFQFKEAIMKRIFFCVMSFFVVAVLLAAGSEKLFSHIPYKSAQWKSKTTVTGTGNPMTIEQTVFFKNGKMRTEAKMKNSSTGQIQDTVTIVDDKFIYSYDKNKKQGTKMSVGSEGSMNPEKQNIEMSKCRKNATKKGSEKVNGVQCTIYEYTCMINNAKFVITEWRNKDGYPIRTVSKYQNIVTTVDTYDLKTNISLSDSLFKPEQDVKFMDMEKIMGESMKKSVIPSQKSKIKDKSDEDEEDSSDDEDEGVDAGEMMKDMMKKYMNK